jgi:flagellar hook-length control protein FliK
VLFRSVTKIDGGKSKIPDKDQENKTKLEETISELRTKISESSDKAAKPAKTATKAAKVEDKPATKTEAKPKVDKNIPRVTPAMTTQLKAEFEKAGNPWEDSYKKEFFDMMNSMDADDYASEGLESRMTTFAESKSPVAAGGNIQSLTVSELHNQNKNLSEVSPGIYQHKTTGKQVTGPLEDTDEELDDATIDGVEYVVGQKTSRVYLSETEEFVGYMGVGKFYDADL